VGGANAAEVIVLDLLALAMLRRKVELTDVSLARSSADRLEAILLLVAFWVTRVLGGKIFG
jgi:hypothetical protein